jgi:hypothetical protein
MNAIQHKRIRRRSRERGSLIILVVVVLTLIALMGAAYLQLTRADRIATSQVTRNNIDAVARATVVYLGNVLAGDLMDEQGRFFMPYDAGVAGTGDESYDHPWSNPDTNQDGSIDATDGYPVQTSDGQLMGNAVGGIVDDTWLASSSPDFSGTPMWPHITHLDGRALWLPDSGGPTEPDEYRIVDTITFPVEADGGTDTTRVLHDTNKLIVGNSAFELDRTPAGFDTLGADADGDGILDSYWTWATIPEIEGMSYVMAVRIIDNSSMINANVALSQTDNTGAIWANLNYAPRMWYPSELDLGTWVDSYGIAGAMPELDALLTYRMPTAGGTLLPTLWGTANNQRIHYWFRGPSLYGNMDPIYRALAIDDELELRFHNGLNNTTQTTNLESLMSTFLGAGNPGASYLDFDTSSGTPILDYYSDNPRVSLTTVSGANIFAPRLENLIASVTHHDYVTSTDIDLVAHNDPIQQPVKVDLNAIFNDTYQAYPGASPAQSLAFEIRKVIERPDGASAFQFPTGTATGLVGRERFANQFAANIIDYVDDNNYLTTIDGMAHGLEALPYVTEVHVQRVFIANASIGSTVVTDPPVLAGPNEYQVTANTSGSENPGYLIEIQNPHAQPIDLNGIALSVNSVIIGGGGDLDSIAGADLDSVNDTTTSNSFDRRLYPNQVIVLYKNSSGGIAPWGDDVLRNMYVPPAWSNGTGYVIGDLVTASDTEAYVCILDHTAAAGNEAGTVAGEMHWRRQRVEINLADAWPYDPSGSVEVTLTALVDNVDDGLVGIGAGDSATVGGEPNDGTIVYARYDVPTWDTIESVTLNRVVMNDPSADPQWRGDWTATPPTNYVVDDLVRDSGPDYRVYISLTAHVSDASNKPDMNSGDWALYDEANTLYVQQAMIGNGEGINRMLFDHDTVSTRPILATTNDQWRTERYNEVGRFGRYDKADGTGVDWANGTAYVVNQIINDPNVGALFRCVTAHTATNANRPENDDGGHWEYYYTGGPDNLVDPDENQVVIGDRARGQFFFSDVGELAHVAVIGPQVTPNATVARYWEVQSVSDVDELMLDFSASSPQLGTVGNETAPYATVLLDRFTTLSPVTDGEDNDGDGTVDNPEELFVPGQLNLNTASEATIIRALPIALGSLRAAIANQIVTYRSDATAAVRNGVRDGYGGIAYLGELYNFDVTGDLLTQAPLGGDTHTLGGVNIDFVSPQNGDPASIFAFDPTYPDGIADDREEEAMIARWLGQMGSTRSDIFTAYIYIRGYRASDFSLGPQEAIRVIAVFDRSNVNGTGDRPRVLAVYNRN